MSTATGRCACGLRTVAAWWMAEHGDYFPHTPDLTEHEYDG